MVWGRWAWRGWVVGGTLRPNSSPSIFQIKEFGVPPFQVLLQARLCPVPDENMRSVGPAGPPFPETRVLHIPGAGQPWGQLRPLWEWQWQAASLGHLPSSVVGVGPPVPTRQDPPVTVQMGILRSGNLPPGS